MWFLQSENLWEFVWLAGTRRHLKSSWSLCVRLRSMLMCIYVKTCSPMLTYVYLCICNRMVICANQVLSIRDCVFWLWGAITDIRCNEPNAEGRRCANWFFFSLLFFFFRITNWTRLIFELISTHQNNNEKLFG